MPTDPKFRTIARAAKQPLPTVVAVFTFMLADASANENERGRTTATDEDIASAFDIEETDVAAIKKAMQGRVLDGDMLAGWEKRQPKKEDNSAERSKAWRVQKQAEAEAERLRTNANAQERPDADTDTDKNQIEKKAPPSPQAGERRGLYSDLKGIYPQTDNTSDVKAERLFNKMAPTEQAAAISQAAVVAAEVTSECRKRNRSAVEHAQYVKGLDSWLREGLWRPRPSTPAQHVPMTKLDRELDAELWAACEQIQGKPAPTSGMTWAFLDSVIDQAQARAAA
jgi:hypothetical protein